jgi:hypothetical protein
MTRRFLWGYHPNFGTIGGFLSKPGWDVLAPSDLTNFLLLPHFKHEQIVQAGVVACGPGSQVVMPLPANFAKKPYVTFQVSQNGNNQYPHDLNLTANPPSTVAEINGTCSIFGDKLTFSNGSSAGLFYHFMVFYRSVSS